MVNNTNNKNHKKELVARCDQSKEVVANSCLDKRPVGLSGDHPEEVVANCDNLQETNLSQYDIEKLIKKVNKITGLKNGPLTNLIV